MLLCQLDGNVLNCHVVIDELCCVPVETQWYSETSLRMYPPGKNPQARDIIVTFGGLKTTAKKWGGGGGKAFMTQTGLSFPESFTDT